MTKIQKCTCKDEWQDIKYGKGLRVMNMCQKPPGFRCTVCGTVHLR